LKAFSIDFVGELALFKKNDANDVVNTSYNFIHKPVILGMFGAICGYSGYAKSERYKKGKIEYRTFPEYYQKLKHLKIAIAPFYKKPLKKVITGFNDASGMGSNAGTWQVEDQILVGEPIIKYRVYVLLPDDIDESLTLLRRKVKKGETEYLLYYGKNEFFAHYENYQEYQAETMKESEIAVISSLIKKSEGYKICKPVVASFDNFDPFSSAMTEDYMIFENLPYDLDVNGYYLKDLFVLSSKPMQIEDTTGFYILKSNEEVKYAQFI